MDNAKMEVKAVPWMFPLCFACPFASVSKIAVFYAIMTYNFARISYGGSYTSVIARFLFVKELKAIDRLPESMVKVYVNISTH